MKARSTRYKIRISHRRTVQVTLRRFRVSAAKQSKRQPQRVINVNCFGIKQVAVKQQVRRTRGRPKTVAARAGFWQPTVSLPLLLVLTGLVGTTFFGSQLVATKSLQPVKVFAVPSTIRKQAPKTLAASVPTHIAIPRVGIDADIIPVGLDANGSIAMPPLFSWDAGWYSASPTPGQLGPAIIVGHVDTYKGISVFWHLREVQPGDNVIITRADGSIASFKINSLNQYDQHNFPTADVYKNINYAGLQLITCSGTFDQSAQAYTENTVVSATLAM